MQLLILSMDSTETNLSLENIITVNKAVEGVSIGEMLTVSSSKLRELQQQETDDDISETIVKYFIEYSPYASWNFIAGRLYYLEQPTALSLARTFINQTPGECVLRSYYTVHTHALL